MPEAFASRASRAVAGAGHVSTPVAAFIFVARAAAHSSLAVHLLTLLSRSLSLSLIDRRDESR